jgi:hypothetical protein
MLIIENYKNVHNGQRHGLSWEKSHEYLKIKTHPLSQLQPNSDSQAMHPTLLPQNSDNYGALTLADCWLWSHDYNWKLKLGFHLINRWAFQTKWGTKDMFNLVHMSWMILRSDTINLQTFWVNCSRLPFCLIRSLPYNSNHLCRHPHSQLFQLTYI